jgi:hypothetical protein
VTKCIPLVALMAIATACGGGGDDDGGGAGDAATTVETVHRTPPPPTAPSGTAPPAATTTDLLNRIPKAGDISKLKLGIPAVAAIRVMSAEVPIEAAGPCGAGVDALVLDGGAGRTYDTNVGHIVGAVVSRSPATDAYVAAVKADLTAGCASHETTIAGATVTLSAPTAVDISATTPDGVAWISTIEQPPDGGQRAVILMPVDDLLVMAFLTSPDTIDPTFVQTMAEVWYDKATAA